MSKSLCLKIASQVLILAVLLLSVGCSSLVSSATSQLADDLAATIMDSDDPETVRTGVPAYLLMIDSLLRSNPENSSILRAASSLNGAFAGAFVEDEIRVRRLTDKSLDYAMRAACVDNKRLCNLQTLDFDNFKAVVSVSDTRDLQALYSVAVAWVSWIQVNSDDWNAIAQLSRTRYLMETILVLDETYDQGGAHLYMGGLDTILPAAMGGKPEQGRMHFERAIELSEGQYLMTKVVYAEQYARLVFDRELHDKLLNEVLAADPIVPGMTLVNKIAQQRASLLLQDSDDYF
jgi:hypothetical protein